MLVNKYMELLKRNGKTYSLSTEFRRNMERDVYQIALRIPLKVSSAPTRYNTPPVKLNGRIYRTLGRFTLQEPYDIELSKVLYEEGTEQDIVLILLHEICHYVLYVGGNKGYNDGNTEFETLLRAVGAPSTGKTPVYANKGYLYECSDGCKIVDARRFPTGYLVCSRHKNALTNKGNKTHLIRKGVG